MGSHFRDLFEQPKAVIAMIHVFDGTLKEQTASALADLRTLTLGELSVDGVIVENYGWGYLDRNHATSQAHLRITEVAAAVVRNSTVPVGVNILPNDYVKAFRACRHAGAAFVQLDHVTGSFTGCSSVDPVHLAEVRRSHGDILLFGGVQPKYYELADPEKIGAAAVRARMLADGIVVTGKETGDETKISDLVEVRTAVGSHPVIVGSGLTPENAGSQLRYADGAIVGSCLKSRIEGPVLAPRVQTLMRKVEEARRLLA